MDLQERYKAMVELELTEFDTTYAGKGPFRLNLFYPRVEGNTDEIILALYDVRAANDIHIKYDFDRDGWSILSDCYDTDVDYDTVDDPQAVIDEMENHREEVAFVPSWPKRKEVLEDTELAKKDVDDLLPELYGRTHDVIGNLELGDKHINDVSSHLLGDIRASRRILHELMQRLDQWEDRVKKVTGNDA